MNSRPAAYKAAALPTELWWRGEPIGAAAKSVSASGPSGSGAKNLIFGNQGKAFIRDTRPQRNRVTGLPCPNCGSELSFLEQYHRHYCYSCGRYAPDGFAEGGPKKCPNCGGILSFVAAYGLQYCYRCGIYPPENAITEWKEPMIEALPATVVPSDVPEVTTVGTPTAKPVEPSITSVEPVVEVTPKTEEIAEEEIRDVPAILASKPPLVREVILDAKKPVLMDLCKAYDLDPNGTKEQLRERLLSYLDELEAAASPTEGEEAPEEQVEETEVIETPAEDASVTAEVEPTIVSTAPEELSQEEPVSYSPPAQERTSAMRTSSAVVVQEPAPVMFARQPEPIVIVPETPRVREQLRGAHPCPTCGRGLTYIGLYSRWYCYSCRTYAPLAKSKNACPNCGASLRWIAQYERWWCDSCRRYAPADLPKPERARIAATSAVTVGRTAESAAAASSLLVHRHRSPGSGIGLMVLGIALFVVYEILVDLRAALAIDLGISLSSDVAWGLRFFAFLFVAAGAMLGLLSVRDQR